jgi:glycosyltransferase involved in cell wall biosynthesis
MKRNVFTVGPSVAYLQKRCLKIFKEKLGKVPVFVGGKNFSWKQGRDVVLMGDALLLLTNSFLWPKTGSFRFWVLSESHKTMLINEFGLTEMEISVIPRNLILPEKQTIRSWPDLDQESTFVISSRLDKEKNIHFTLHLASVLQKKFPRMRVAIFSPSQKDEEAKKLISRFKWKLQPKYYGDKGFHWYKAPLVNPFLVNFSTYALEDFGVSIAQARNKGWPVLLSDWKVFREVGPSMNLKISAEDIDVYNQLTSKKSKAHLVCRVASELDFNQKSQQKFRFKTSLKNPRMVKAMRLAKLQESWTLERREILLKEFY